MKKLVMVVVAAAAASFDGNASPVAPAVRDAMRTAALGDVRLEGFPARKMHALFHERCTSDFAKTEVFGEARSAFRDRDDDIVIPIDGKPETCGGLWRGEFWGKLMLSSARVADYLQDPAFTKWIGEECHRMMALQDPDGYLGSYANRDAIASRHLAEFKKAYGWTPCWNLWNRKYAMWGLFMAYKVTGERTILDSACRLMDYEIDQLDRLGLRIEQTGALEGLPSMSVLKPLLMLYAETGTRRYLDFARKIVDTWKRPDAPKPAFFLNTANGKPLHTWYPKPQDWAKSYEMMSCLDGILEYYRMTGEKECLEVVKLIRDNLNATESNPFGAVGFGDKFIGSTKYVNGLNEICDVIHWIRLNLDLFLITGDDRYMDSVEVAYFNAYLAGINRKGDWGPGFIRGCGRHAYHNQIGYAYSQCCVNNLPRTFMDVASAVVTAEANGDFRVNFYQDATVKLDGVTFEIRGNYPVGNRVTVKVRGLKSNQKVNFRKPRWCRNMQVASHPEPRDAQLSTFNFQLSTFTIAFDMNPRLIERGEGDGELNARNDKNWSYKRYREHWSNHINRDVQKSYRTNAAARVMWGPLVLTKSCFTGLSRREAMNDATVNGKGYSLEVKSAPGADNCGVWGMWDVKLSKPGEPAISVRACDFGSGTDRPTCENGEFFSIWF